MRRTWRPAVLATLVAHGSCATEPAALSVDDVAFAEDELLGLSSTRRGELGELVALGLMVARDQTDRVGEPLNRALLRGALVQQAVAERVLTDNGVEDEHLRTQYLMNPEFLLTVRHVLFFSERWRSAEHRAQAARKATAALERLRAGEPFPSVAAELSEEPGAEGREGLLPPGGEGTWVPEFWRAAVILGVDEISPVVETEYGFHVLRLEAKDTISFQDVRPSLAYQTALLIEDLPGATRRWLDVLEQDIVVVATAIPDWSEGALPSTARLAGWADGELTAADFEIHVQTFDRTKWAAVHEDPEVVADELLRASAV